ncbi:hypothetical protein [Streptomyces profundus]|uniref:hypothetical protein n=1 Tax=Streptomyces profundus TaxID=2867410 RepID=UPI001D15E9AE|nr:hypothetical protein [Streptomyces sp. MA3_2.13]UED87312.1 hypothetical protein K4G22_26440 [Streptomyces sp. MA3_2.13]
MATREEHHQDDARKFDEVQIGKGVRPVAQHGQVTVADGTLTLLGSNGRLIGRAPVAEVSAVRVRFTGGRTVRLRLHGTRYHVSPGWGDKAGGLLRPGRPQRVARDAAALLDLIEAGGGTVR